MLFRATAGRITHRLANTKVLPWLRSLRRRIAAPVVLLAGAFVAMTAAPHVPREHSVDLVLDEPKAVTAVEVSWLEGRSPPKGEDEHVQAGCTWQFPKGAPALLPVPARLPDGTYRLDGIVQRPEGRTPFRRVVILGDAQRVTLRVP